MTLSTLPADRCPVCTKPTVIDTIDQPALIRHGGYGATQRRTWRSCTTCGWWVETSVSEVSP